MLLIQHNEVQGASYLAIGFEDRSGEVVVSIVLRSCAHALISALLHL